MHRSQINLQRIIVPKWFATSDPPKSETPPPINIWIHGTLFVRKQYFYQSIGPIQELHKIKTFHDSFHIREIGNTLNQRDPINFPLETLYAFGWSGNLNAYERLQAAKNLYNQLQELIKQYIEEWGVYPVIRIITHSHGGNVALYLAFVDQAKQEHLVIDTLLMLACPVQTNTMHFADNSVFKNVYSLYSSLDLIQVIAPQRFNEKLPFSSREFPRHFNVIQARVRLNGHALLHTEFTSRSFISSIPLLLKELAMVKENKLHLHKKRIVLHITTSRALLHKQAKRHLPIQKNSP